MNTLKFGSYQGPIHENKPEKNLANVKKILSENCELDFLCFPIIIRYGFTCGHE